MSDSEDLIERLGQLVSTVDEPVRPKADSNRALVLALTDQLAAGQSETLYSLQTASSGLRKRTAELERLVAGMPDDIATRLDALVEQITDAAAQQVGAVLESAAARLDALVDGARALDEVASGMPDNIASRVAAMVEQMTAAAASQIDTVLGAATSQIDTALGSVTSQIGTVLDTATTRLDAVVQGAGRLDDVASRMPEDIAKRVGGMVDQITEASAGKIGSALDAASTRLGIVAEGVHQKLDEGQARYLAVLRESAESTGARLSDELERAAKTIVDSAGRAKASQTVVRAAAAAMVETLEESVNAAREEFITLQEQLFAFVEQTTSSMGETADAFVADGEALTQGITAVGDSFVNKLFQVLDERDARERDLEDRLNSRIDVLMETTTEQLSRLTRALEQQVVRLETRSQEERAANAADLHALVDRLLAQPRGRLRDLRAGTRGAVPAAVPPVASYSPPVRRPVAPPAPVKAAPPVEAAAEPVLPEQPARRAAVKKAPAKKAPATKAEPAKAEPAKAEPAKGEPAKPEAKKAAPAKAKKAAAPRARVKTPSVPATSTAPTAPATSTAKTPTTDEDT